MWTVNFATNKPDAGAGVVVFESNRLFGGDSSFYYVGDYVVKDGIVSANVHVERHNNFLPSAMGLDNFTLKLSGKVDHDQFTVNGHAVEAPNNQITVLFKRLTELPNPG